MSNLTVLIIDDEPQIRRALRLGLEHNGYNVTLAATGEEGLDIVASVPPDMVILDLSLPGLQGLEVCERLRRLSSVPIVVLSVRDSEDDKIAALDLGADDYLTKPFSLDELLARMRAALRRVKNDSSPGATTFSTGDLLIDFVRRRVSLAGNIVHLTPIEYELLKFMAMHAGLVLSHSILIGQLWGEEAGKNDHKLRVHIANLREKIEPNPARPRFLHTEPRIGYRLIAD